MTAAAPTPDTNATVDPILLDLYERIADCPNCILAKTRTRTVPGSGPATSEVMFVGEGPGQREDERGVPFVGPAGKLLDELLAAAGWTRADVYVTNVVKCRPPGNRDPETEEMAACAPFLEEQLRLLNPRLIVTLGRFSMARWFPGAAIRGSTGSRAPSRMGAWWCRCITRRRRCGTGGSGRCSRRTSRRCRGSSRGRGRRPQREPERGRRASQDLPRVGSDRHRRKPRWVRGVCARRASAPCCHSGTDAASSGCAHTASRGHEEPRAHADACASAHGDTGGGESAGPR